MLIKVDEFGFTIKEIYIGGIKPKIFRRSILQSFKPTSSGQLKWV